ncbi:bifunctional nicotinamidase/pyrazinamidase [Christiangramia sp. SM2212]|uniref:nicotinamidase n=1 Tax=Christiangramia sediminicola TaxID=3073267 RepID=A0ABU1EU32_9FLAO|nr:bifunctional nicotinamidase/pyrazinamidase [Christiangramia sp. SM2212]MDR5591474.1 bifunctional nicotinamidase/pyrazinamidase [Christiangramia sp. SM2212]
MKTLIIIDVQNDFMPGGALAVSDGDKIVPLLNDIQQKFDLVIATQDWHPEKHASFATSHKNGNEFEVIDLNGIQQVLWPEHCIQNSYGAKFHSDLETSGIETIFRKGTDISIDSYSGFYDNAHLKSTGLTGYLREKGAKELYFVGLAAEYCVKFSILDALEEGFSATLIENGTRALSEDAFKNAKTDIVNKGGKIIDSSELDF